MKLSYTLLAGVFALSLGTAVLELEAKCDKKGSCRKKSCQCDNCNCGDNCKC